MNLVQISRSLSDRLSTGALWLNGAPQIFANFEPPQFPDRKYFSAN
jgi:hypothetical protein